MVTVVAVDDEPPVFNPASYTKSISEAEETGKESKTMIHYKKEEEKLPMSLFVTF